VLDYWNSDCIYQGEWMLEKNIFTVDAPCGAGKTKGLVEYLTSIRILDYKNIIIQPTKDLCRETYKSFLENGYRENIFILNSDNTSVVTINIIEKIKEINKVGRGTLIITQEAYNLLKYFPSHETWRLYIDEIPNIDSEVEVLIPYNTELLNQYFDIEYFNDELYKINVKGNIQEFLGRSEDRIDDIIRPIIHAFASGNIIYTKKDSWDRIVTDKVITQDVRIDRVFGNKKNKLYFLIINNIEKYLKHEETILLGANISNSIFYEYGKSIGVNFTKHHSISKYLNYETHLNGNLVTIYYMQDKRASNYNKKLFNKEENTTNEEFYDQIVIKHLDKKPCLYVCNNKDSLIPESNFIKIKNVSHGTNKYLHINNVYVKSVLNRNNHHLKMLSSIGIDTDFANRSMYHEISYQICMRTSLRNIYSTEPVSIYVHDKASANYLGSLLIGCKIEQLGKNKEDIVTLNSYQKQKRKTLDELFADVDLTEKNKCHISILKNIYTSDSHVAEEESVYDLFSEFKKYFVRNLTEKKDGMVFSPGIFDGIGKTKENVLCSDILVLDCDDGDISPIEFKKIFEFDFKYSCIIMNTFSTSKDDPNRFRVIFALDRKVDNDEYYQLQKHIQNILQDYGYVSCSKQDRSKYESSKFSGIDLTKVSPASLFYMPCQNVNRIEDAFFIRLHAVNKQSFIRHTMKVNTILQTNTIENLQDGWDGIDSIAPKKTDISIIEKFVNKLPIYIEKPKLMASSTGIVGCYWDSPKRYVDLQLEDDLFSLYYRNRLTDEELFMPEYRIADFDENWINTVLLKYLIEPEDTQLQKKIRQKDKKVDIDTLPIIKQEIQDKYPNDFLLTLLMSGNYDFHDHYLFGRLAASMFDAGFSEQDFRFVIPIVTKGKKDKEISDVWKNWSKYKNITKGTLLYMMGLVK
jgi:hypothetical protein